MAAFSALCSFACRQLAEGGRPCSKKFLRLPQLAWARIADTSWIKPGKVLRDAILDRLAAWGVKGVKYGFVNVAARSGARG